jgi:hypothetical protein
MKASQILLLGTSLLSLSACSKYLEKFSRLTGAGMTEVKFTSASGEVSLANTMLGGIMVYAMRTDGYTESFVLSHEGDSTSFPLPNGSYKFLAVGWDTSGLAGTNKCGSALAGGSDTFNLAGSTDAMVIPIDLAAANCADNKFAAATHRSGSSFISPDFVFCGGTIATTSISGVSDNCNAGKESYRFFGGNPSGGTGVTEIRPSNDGTFTFYLADPHADNRMELFSVKFSGSDTVKQNPPLTGSQVTKFETVPNSSKAVYLAKQDSNVVDELYLTTAGQPGSTKISGLVETDAATWGVKSFEISADGRWVVFVGKMQNTPGVHEIYSVDLQSSGYPRTKLNPAIGLGIQDQPLSSGYFGIRLSKSSPYKVLYAAHLSIDGGNPLYHLHQVNPDGTGHTRLSNNPGCANGTAIEISDFQYNYNDTKVGWKQDCDSDGIFQAYITPSGSDSRLRLNPTDIINGVPRLYLSNVNDVALLDADNSTSGHNDVYSVNFSIMAQATIDGAARVKLFDETTAGLTIDNPVFSPDGTKVIYLRDTDTAGPIFNKLYGATIGSAGSQTLLSTSTTNSNTFPTNGGGNPPYFFANNTDIYYLSDAGANAGRNGLYKAGIATPGTLVGLNPSAVPNAAADTKKVTAGPGNKIFYTMDKYSDNQYIGLAFDPAGPTNTSLDFSATMISNTEFNLPRPGETIPGFTNGGILAGRVDAAATHEDAWLIDDITVASPSLTKLTHMWNGGTKVGRFRIGLLRYKSGMPLHSAPMGLNSGCLEGPVTDGTAAAASAKLPAGPGSLSPFATAVDVYPTATSCSGPFTRVVYPYGLAAPAADSNKTKNLANGAQHRIFVHD